MTTDRIGVLRDKQIAGYGTVGLQAEEIGYVDMAQFAAAVRAVIAQDAAHAAPSGVDKAVAWDMRQKALAERDEARAECARLRAMLEKSNG